MSNYGLLFPFIFYNCVGIFGYTAYTDETLPNFLESFLPTNVGYTLYVFTYISIIMAVLMTYPIYFFEARNTFLYFIDLATGYKKLINDNPFQENMETRKDDVLMEPLRKEQYVYTVILFLLSIATAFIFNNFGTIVSLNGATAGNLIGLILPASYYLYCVREMKIKKKETKNMKYYEIVAWAMLSIGILTMIIGIAFFSPTAG